MVARISTAAAAAWQWPIRGLTEKIASGIGEELVEHLGLGRIALGRTRSVCVDIGHLGGSTPESSMAWRKHRNTCCRSGSMPTTL